MSSQTPWTHLFLDANLATMDPARGEYGALHGAALATSGDRIAWLGEAKDLPGRPEKLAAPGGCHKGPVPCR